MEFDEDGNCDGGVVPKFGAIFMSNIATKRECLKRKIFGLPLAQANFVKQVKSGMILFLFEFEKRELHGVFRATSDGTMNLIPHAYSSSRKQFPAQVRIAPIWLCSPLPEVVFRDAITDNYYSPKKFHFGLSENQVRVLLQLFYSRRVNNRMPRRQIADEMTREADNKRQKTDGRIMVTGTFEQEARDCIKSPSLNECPEKTCNRAERVDDDRILTGDKLEYKANYGLSHTIGVNSPDVHWTNKRKITDDGRFSDRDASESGLFYNCTPRHATSTDRLGDTSGTINLADDMWISAGERATNVHMTNDYQIFLGGSVGADREPLIIRDRYENDHNMGDGTEPDILIEFPRYNTLRENKILVDYGKFSMGERVENACDVESCIRPDFSSNITKAFRRSEQNLFLNSMDSNSEHPYASLIKPNLESDSFTLQDQVQYSSACHLPNRSKSFTQTSLVSNDAVVTRTVPYDPEFPDLTYRCSSHILDSGQDLSSHKVPDPNFLSVSTSEGVAHEACSGHCSNNESKTLMHEGHKGSLYSESSSVRPSVFSRLSVTPRRHKKDDNDIGDECDMLASVDEVMELLHQDHNHWVKAKKYRPSVGVKNKYVYVRCKEEAESLNQLNFEQPAVTKEVVVDVNYPIEEDSDILLRETRAVDFKRRSKMNKNLDEMVKRRKLIRPDFSRKEFAHDLVSGLTSSSSAQDSPSVLSEVTAPPGNFEGKEENDEINHQVDSGAKDLEQKRNLQNDLGIENQVKLSIQDLVSSLTSGSNAQDPPSATTEVTAVPGNFKGEEGNAEINNQVDCGANNFE